MLGRLRGPSLILFVVVVCIGLVLPSAWSARTGFAQAQQDETNAAYATAAQRTGTLIQMLQRERGLTNIQLTERVRAGDGTVAPAVRAARTATDQALASWRGADADLGSYGDGKAGAGLLLRRLPEQRRMVDTGARPDAGAVFDAYSTVIGALLDLVAAGAGPGVSDQQRLASTWYLAVLRTGEELGRERGEVAGLLAAADPPRSRIASSVATHRRARNQLLALARDAADRRQRSALEALNDGPAAASLSLLEQQALAGDVGGLSAGSWFAACTAVLDDYLAVAQAEGRRLQASAAAAATAARQRAWRQVVISGLLLLCAGLIASGLLLAAARRRAGEQIAAAAQRELELTGQLMEQIRAQAAELQERADSLARSNAELEQFAYVASHDLQEPLRKVTNYVEILRADYGHLLDQDGHEYMHYVTDGARRMRQLIDDLLALSRMRKERQIAKPCDLNDVVAGVLDELELSIRDADATVVVDRLPVLQADRAHMHQLFLNLISNALKYRAEAPPVVTVRATRESDFWRIDVQDNGIGFKQQYAERVFGMFQRLVTRAEYAGTGIGLAIVAKVVANHGGTVAAVSQPGAGATFTVTLPMGVPAPRDGAGPDRADAEVAA